MKPLLSIVTVLAAFVLTSCAQQCVQDVISRMPLAADTSDVDRSLVDGSPCKPPCWQGIYPGNTDRVDADTILRNLDFIDVDSVQYLTASESITWESSLSESKSWLGSVDFVDEVVSQIRIRQIEYDLTLGELIEIYGMPDGVWVVDSIPEAPACYTLHIVWITHGFMISLPSVHQSDVQSGNQHLTPDTSIVSVIYFSSMDNLQDYVNQTGYRIQEWAGYQSSYINRP